MVPAISRMREQNHSHEGGSISEVSAQDDSLLIAPSSAVQVLLFFEQSLQCFAFGWTSRDSRDRNN
jgi:hypothetical protein